jgi:hypothetical protein
VMLARRNAAVDAMIALPTTPTPTTLHGLTRVRGCDAARVRSRDPSARSRRSSAMEGGPRRVLRAIRRRSARAIVLVDRHAELRPTDEVQSVTERLR